MAKLKGQRDGMCARGEKIQEKVTDANDVWYRIGMSHSYIQEMAH